MMHIPDLVSLHVSQLSKQRNSPIKDKNLLGKTQPLYFPSSDSDIVEETETHVLVGFGVMTWWTNNCECVSHNAFAYVDGSCNRTSTGEFGASRRFAIDIEG